MAEFEGVAFRATSVRFKPEAHAKFAKWAKDAKMSRSEFALMLMNEGVRSIRARRAKPSQAGKPDGA